MTGPDPFPAIRMLLVCDNASVHKADEIKKLMEQYGIILMFLPPNMMQWLQPLDRVVCGLIKIVQHAPRAALGNRFETKKKSVPNAGLNPLRPDGGCPLQAGTGHGQPGRAPGRCGCEVTSLLQRDCGGAVC